jgi:hypothetical protein
VEEIYYQMYLLAIGIQMAGPTSPRRRSRRDVRVPRRQRAAAAVGLRPGDYTPTDDFREIWWDPNRISGQNNKPGAWVQLNGGARWSPDKPPTGPPASSRRAEVAELEHASASTNGSTPTSTIARPARALRTEPENVHLFRGYGRSSSARSCSS